MKPMMIRDNEFIAPNFDLYFLLELKKVMQDLRINYTLIEKGLKNQLKLQKQPLFQYLDNREKKIEIEERTKLWFIELKKIHSEINTQFNVTTTHNNDDQFTPNFKTCMKKFWDRIVLETDYINKFESKKRKCASNHGKGGSKSQRNS
ncbi:4665_t:CDS:2 [Entrophospora sp. SA101]|nr:4665_t:CDS:2 [Entrophospora sp. SA101]